MQTDQDKIKVVIVDDEPQSILRLENDLAALEDFEVIATSRAARSPGRFRGDSHFLFGDVGKDLGDEHAARCAVHRCRDAGTDGFRGVAISER